MHQGIALEEPGHLLVTDIPGPVGAAAGQPVGLHAQGPLAGLGQLGIDQIDVGLFMRDLGSQRIGRRRCGLHRLNLRQTGTWGVHACASPAI